MFGAYKVEMKFTFITKLGIGHRERLQAAGLIDFVLRYFQEWGGMLH